LSRFARYFIALLAGASVLWLKQDMPHLTITHSKEVYLTSGVWQGFSQDAHAILAEKLPTDIETCRSRAIPAELWSVGTQGRWHNFVHATLEVMPGRSEETLKATAEAILDCMKTHFANATSMSPCQMSVEVRDLSPAYAKITLG
jgi:5-carboxymethyl-2-hydroxymuconate isomerase